MFARAEPPPALLSPDLHFCSVGALYRRKGLRVALRRAVQRRTAPPPHRPQRSAVRRARPPIEAAVAQEPRPHAQAQALLEQHSTSKRRRRLQARRRWGRQQRRKRWRSRLSLHSPSSSAHHTCARSSRLCTAAAATPRSQRMRVGGPGKAAGASPLGLTGASGRCNRGCITKPQTRGQSPISGFQQFVCSALRAGVRTA